MNIDENESSQGRARERAGLDEEPIRAPRNSRMIKSKDVARKIQSFEHFAHIWGDKEGYYLPPKKYVTWQFVAQLLAGQKMQQVGHPVELPKGTYVQELY